MRYCINLFLIFLLFSHLAKSQTKWRFAVIGDTHVGSSDTVAEMIPYMESDSIDCVLICGDIVEGGLACTGVQLQAQLNDWKTIFSPLYQKGIGVYPIRGNHENDAKNDINAWNTVFSGNDALPQNGPSGENNLSYSFHHNNALFIGLDNYVNIHQVNQTWLDQKLDTNTYPHVFVFGHEAAFKVFHADCLDDSVNQRNTFWSSLSNAGVKAYFCGHDHFVDIARIDDGDGNQDNDVYQYLVGTGGGWLMDQYSNYNGMNSPYVPSRVFHDMNFGYTLVEVSGESKSDCDVSIVWKKRTWNSQKSVYEYVDAHVINYSVCSSTSIIENGKTGFDIYPNPANDFIEVNGCKGLIKIFNTTGSLVWSGMVDSNQQIHVSDFKSGIYFLSCGSMTKKFNIVR